MSPPLRLLKDWVIAWNSLSVTLRRRFCLLGLLLLGTNVLMLAHEPLLTGLAYRFRAQDPPAPSDAIVVLLGSYADRSARAAELYREGLAPIILIGQAQAVRYDETEYNRRSLMDAEVPASAIRILPGGVVENTHDEALRVRDYLRTHPARRITVVTTAYHTARARWTFRRVLRGSGVDIRVTASEDRRFSESDWYTSDDGIKIYFWEAVANPYYRVTY